MSNGILEQTKSFGQPIIDKRLITERNSIEKQFLLDFLMSDHTLDQVKNLDVSDMKNIFACGSLDNILAELESVKPTSHQSCKNYICNGKENFLTLHLMRS